MAVSRFGRLDVDLFASAAWHVTERFMTPGCFAVDALRSDWRTLVRPDNTAWIFPPARALMEVVQNLKLFKTTAIQVIPEAPTINLWVEFIELGKEARMERPLLIERTTNACIPSRRVPPGTVNSAMFKLRVYGISRAS